MKSLSEKYLEHRKRKYFSSEERYLDEKRGAQKTAAETQTLPWKWLKTQLDLELGWNRLKIKFRLWISRAERFEESKEEAPKKEAPKKPLVFPDKQNATRYLPVKVASMSAVSVVVLQLIAPSYVEAAVRGGIDLVFREQKDKVIAEVDRTRECQDHIAIMNEANEVIGFIAKNKCDTTPISMISVSTTSPSQNQSFVEIASSLEGQFYASDGGLCNIAPRDLAAIPIRYLRGRVSGASTLPMQVMRNIDGNPSFGLSRKMDYLANLWKTILYSQCDSDRARIDKLIVENQPAVVGAPGSAFGTPLAVSAAAPFLFGHRFEETSRAEQCILAAAGKRQILVVAPTSHAEVKRLAHRQLEKVKARALSMCEDYPEAFAEINRMQTPVLQRASSGAHGESRLHGARTHLFDEIKLANKRQESVLHVSLSERQPNFAKQIRAYTQRLAPLTSNEVCIQTDCRDHEEPIDVLVALAEHDDNALKTRLVLSNRHGLFTGTLKKDEENNWTSGATTRSVGSLNKQLIAASLNQLGVEKLCNKQRKIGARLLGNPENAPFAKYGYKECTTNAMVRLRDAYAHSANLPFIDAVSKKTSYFKALFENLQFAEGNPDDQASFATKSVLGFGVTAPPSMYMSLSAGLFELIHNGKVYSHRPSMFVKPLGETENLSNYSPLSEPMNSNKLLSILNSPIDTGTLIGLGGVLKDHGCEWRSAIGKSGTSESAGSEQAVRDVLLSVSFNCGEKAYSAFVLLGTPNDKLDLGEISTRHLIKIIELSIPHLLFREARHA